MLKEEIISKAIMLAEGRIDPIEVSEWAIQLELQNKDIISNILKDDAKVIDLLESLQLAGQLGENGLLYGSEDFEEWLSEFQNS